MAKPIRAAIVGGHRGGGYGRALGVLAEQIRLTAICDLNPEVVASWQETRPELRGFLRYEDLLESDACDAVLLATPMELHARQAVQALRAGKHVLSEVVASSTMDDCWALVEAVEASDRVYLLAENYTYMRPNMLVRHLVERGLFGEVYYAEGAYVHDCRPLMFDARGEITWRGESGRLPPANSYPTHSLGPVAQWLGCAGPGATDRLVEVVCFTTPDRARRRYALDRFGPEHPAAQPGFFQRGDSASTLIRTEKASVAYVRVDTSSPRPHNMTHYVLQGTEAAYLAPRQPREDPLIWIRGRSPGEAIGKEEWQSLWDFAGDYEHPRWRERGEVARGAGHGGGDFFIIEDFVSAIVDGTPPAIDVYDAVTWSSIYPLSLASVRDGGRPQAIPDFRQR
jgi:predicted dehydrogenase